MDLDGIRSVLGMLTSTPSRRAVGRTVIGLATGSLLTPLIGRTDSEAKKKRKKKKKCKSGTRKCGKQCIAATACCSSAECGEGGHCAGGTCQCASGFVETCDGVCIPDEPGLIVCCEPNILCQLECCDVAAGEVCHVAPSAEDTCQTGGCPAVGLCQVEDYYACAGRNAQDINGLCQCTTPIDGGEGVCVTVESLDCDNTCTSSGGCGAGRICIANGEWCGCEEEVVGFCGTLCSDGCGANCSAGAPSRAHRQTGSAWLDVLAPKLGGRQRSPHP